MELRPQHMDDSGKTKYPVLFRVYFISSTLAPKTILTPLYSVMAVQALNKSKPAMKETGTTFYRTITGTSWLLLMGGELVSRVES